MVTQQCRAEDLQAARAVYEETHIVHQLDTFFQDVPRLMAEAHLAICRSGASTLAELTAIGRPAILIPYPFAADDHQTANAAALESAGGGWLMPQGALTHRHLVGAGGQPARRPQDADRGRGGGEDLRHNEGGGEPG